MSSKSCHTICPYCGVGCGLSLTQTAPGVLELEGRKDYPVNRGSLCSKGRYLHHTSMNHENRLTAPTVKDGNGIAQPVSWETAMDIMADAFRNAQRSHGNDSVGMYVSGQCLTEEYYLANKITKGFLSTNNIDTNSRLCMSSAVMGYKAVFGDDLVPASYEDLDLCSCFLVAGANPSWCHPILWRRVEARKEAHPETKIIVVDPRRTETCAFADLHLQILPGTDIYLFNAIASQLLEQGWIDQDYLTAHCEEEDAFRAQLGSLSLSERAEKCGIPEEEIKLAAQWIGESQTFMSLWTMGLNQSRIGTDKNIALIQLSLLRGAVGKPGCGPLSLTGQPNAMGGREVGGMATLLASHYHLNNKEHRKEVQQFWGCKPIRTKPGLTAMEMVEALENGKLKVLWIVATNPAVSFPDQDRFAKAIQNADLVVVQDFTSKADTLAFADIVLPAATWLEKDGTMTNSERRISRVRKLMDAPGDALPDAEIFIRFAHAMGWRTSFRYEHVSEVFDEYARMTKGRPTDITGVSYARLDKEGSVQWPCPEGSKGTTRLFEDGKFATVSGKANLIAVPDQAPELPLGKDYPLVLTTGRIRDQWHTMTRTGKVKRLNLQEPAPGLEVHPRDAEKFRLKDGWPVRVESPYGQATLVTKISENVRESMVFAPMHWGRKHNGGKGLINRVVEGPVDPKSSQPDFKFTPVKISPVKKFPKRIVVVGAGAGALQFVTSYREFNRDDEVIVLGKEPRGFYNRILLPEYLTGELSWETLVTLKDEEVPGFNLQFEQGVSISAVNPEDKTVLAEDGRCWSYDTLVLSTGSRAFVPPGVPMEMPGIYTMRTKADADAARKDLGDEGRVLVMGGGLLGIELAASLDAAGFDCDVIEMAPRLMLRQLDETAGGLLKLELEERGIGVFTGDCIVEYLTDKKGNFSGAKTRGGLVIHADLLFVAVGTRPNIEYLDESGLECNRGVIVNDHLQTSDPYIFALGEIAEHQGMLYGITAGAQDQAKIAARFIAGDDWSSYSGSTLFNILKIHGREVRAAGLNEIPEGSEEDPQWEDVIFHDKRKRIYQRCIVHRNRLVGAQFIGNADPWEDCKRWIDQGIELEAERDSLLRGAAEAREPVKGRLVCTCNQVGEKNLQDAIHNGCVDLEALCSKTRAGTGCGSCRPDVKRILETALPPLALSTV